jgi:multicomponent Na+:H+ antiporter subunit D
VGKLGLLEAGVDADALVPVVVSLVASLLTLVSMTKIWTQVFWGRPTVVAASAGPAGAPVAAPAGPARSRALMTGATAGVVGVTLAVALFAQPLWSASVDAAEDLVDRGTYLSAVTGEVPDGP